MPCRNAIIPGLLSSSQSPQQQGVSLGDTSLGEERRRGKGSGEVGEEEERKDDGGRTAPM
jgi:hypothetical protein